MRCFPFALFLLRAPFIARLLFHDVDAVAARFAAGGRTACAKAPFACPALNLGAWPKHSPQPETLESLSGPLPQSHWPASALQCAVLHVVHFSLPRCGLPQSATTLTATILLGQRQSQHQRFRTLVHSPFFHPLLWRICALFSVNAQDF